MDNYYPPQTKAILYSSAPSSTDTPDNFPAGNGHYNKFVVDQNGVQIMSVVSQKPQRCSLIGMSSMCIATGSTRTSLEPGFNGTSVETAYDASVGTPEEKLTAFATPSPYFVQGTNWELANKVVVSSIVTAGNIHLGHSSGNVAHCRDGDTMHFNGFKGIMSIEMLPYDFSMELGGVNYWQAMELRDPEVKWDPRPIVGIVENEKYNPYVRPERLRNQPVCFRVITVKAAIDAGPLPMMTDDTDNQPDNVRDPYTHLFIGKTKQVGLDWIPSNADGPYPRPNYGPDGLMDEWEKRVGPGSPYLETNDVTPEELYKYKVNSKFFDVVSDEKFKLSSQRSFTETESKTITKNYATAAVTASTNVPPEAYDLNENGVNRTQSTTIASNRRVYNQRKSIPINLSINKRTRFGKPGRDTAATIDKPLDFDYRYKTFVFAYYKDEQYMYTPQNGVDQRRKRYMPLNYRVSFNGTATGHS